MRFATRLVPFVAMSLLITSIAAPVMTDTQEGSRAGIDDPALRGFIKRITDNVTVEMMHSTIENLTAFGTRYAHSSKNIEAVEWIVDKFEEYGLVAEKWPFTHQGEVLYNVIAELPGTDPDGYYIICAHLDTINRTSSWNNPEAPAPGADDDATGIATVLAAAELLGRFSFKQSIRFIAFNAEELYKAVGSTYYAENVSLAGEDLLGVLNIDMIGFNDRYFKMDIVYNPASHYMFTEYVFKVNSEFHFIEYLFDKEDPQSATSWGDVEPFWTRGYDGIAFVEDMYPRENSSHYKANPNYHTVDDDIDTLNMELVMKGSQLTIGTLIMVAEPTLLDLKLTGSDVPDGLIFDGDDVTINATIANTGNLDAVQVPVRLLVDGQIVDETNVTITADDQVNVSFVWEATYGDHVINISVDPDDIYGEWNDYDNEMSVERFVQLRPDVDLEEFYFVEDHIDEGATAGLVIKAYNYGPTDIEFDFVLMDDRRPSAPLLTEFVYLGVGEYWEKVLDWKGVINGTHVLTGELAGCMPGDRNITNNVRTDSIDVNGIPVAGFDHSPKVGALTYQKIEFHAGSSHDDKVVTGYSFDLGDGNTTGWLDLPFATHNYTDDGTYNVTLIVRDADGAQSAPVAAEIVIENRPPVVDITANRLTAETNVPITFSSERTYDLDGRIVSYNWTFLGQHTFYSTRANPTVAFNGTGEYTARLLVKDDDGATASGSMTVSISNKAPKAVIEGPRFGTVKEVLSFSGLASTDEDGRIESFYWDFDDGTVSAESSPVHAYGQPGNYTVELKVRDNHGGIDIATVVVVITEKPREENIEMAPTDVIILAVFLVIVLMFAIAEGALGPPGPPKRRKKAVSKKRKKKGKGKGKKKASR